MADLSRKMIQQNVERFLTRELKRVTNKEVDVGELANRVVDAARRVVGRDLPSDLPEPMSFGESLVAIAKSVRSVGDLERRIRRHRRDFARVWRTTTRELAQILTAMSEPQGRETRESEGPGNLDGTIAAPPALDEGTRPLDEDR